MPSRHHSNPSRPNGFSLVEIMVGMAIGLIAVLIIMQVFSVFERQKQSTTGNADAQTNGTIALYSMQRDAQMAGYGLPLFDTINPPLKCDPSPTVDHDNNAGTPAIGMFPIGITDGGAAAGASDRIAIRYGPTTMGGIPVKILSAVATEMGVDNNLPCKNGDIVMISNGAACGMTRVNDANLAADTTHITLAAAPASAAAGASLACLGGWNEFVYAINNNQLERNGTPVVASIVNLQAQYGISAAANSNQVIQWVNATGVTWAAPSVANRNLIKAIRIVIVARNGLPERTNVTPTCTTAQGTANNGPCAWDDTTPAAPAGFVASPAPKIDLSNDANWQRYRYRVYETIIPMRNMVWSRNTL